MTKKEFTLIFTSLIAAYPNAKIMGDKASLEFWYRMLADFDVVVAENAVMEYIATETFPPSIAGIRKRCMDRMVAAIPSADDAWGTVQNAISKYGFHNPEEAFATMNELTLSIVKNLGWSNLCMSENHTADRANFRMAYEEKAKEIEKMRQLPGFVAQRRLELQEKYIPVIEQKPVPKIETVSPKKPVPDVPEDEERLAKHGRLLEDLRRRLLGG